MEESSKIIPEGVQIAASGENEMVTVPDVELVGQQSLNSKGISNATEDSICEKFSQSLSLDAKCHRSFSKCSTFPVSKGNLAYSLSADGKGGQGQGSSASIAIAYSRTLSLPSSSTLVSAMKGGRALNGVIVKVDLHVKWAPDVYDPPSTSMSHTVRSHQQRPKPKKKDKYKHKGKSARGNGGDRRQENRRSFNKAPEPLNVRLQGNGDRLILDCFSKPNILEYGINGQEAKCGSSFLKEALPKMHLPIGEAS